MIWPDGDPSESLMDHLYQVIIIIMVMAMVMIIMMETEITRKNQQYCGQSDDTSLEILCSLPFPKSFRFRYFQCPFISYCWPMESNEIWWNVLGPNYPRTFLVGPWLSAMIPNNIQCDLANYDFLFNTVAVLYSRPTYVSWFRWCFSWSLMWCQWLACPWRTPIWAPYFGLHIRQGWHRPSSPSFAFENIILISADDIGVKLQ